MGRYSRRHDALRRAEDALKGAFRSLEDAGDALVAAGCGDDGRAVHGVAVRAALWRNHVERMREKSADGRD